MTTPDFSANPDNFCYRHPGRQSFVLCQRCMRTICPDCQTQAPVGVICPECMQQQRRGESRAQRRARRGMQGGFAGAVAVRDGRPVVTYGIIGVTSAVSLLQMVPGIGGYLTRALQFWAGYLYPSLSGATLEPWRLLTVLLVHNGILHLGLNMLALWMLGQILEPLIGRARFVTLYLVAGLGGSVGVAVLAPNSAVVGASGAIFGLLTALLVIGRHLGANMAGILVVLGINLVIGFVPGFNVSWQAHLGGAVVGAVVGLIYARTGGRRHERFWWIGLTLALTLVLLLVLWLVVPALITAGN